MPDWLIGSIATESKVDWQILVFRLTLGLTLGCVVAGIYRITHGREQTRTIGLAATLVMLTVLIGMVTQVIGDSVARAFSLVGALSIVRFRTVVEDTRDTAFVIFAVGVGMAVGAGSWLVAVIGIPFVAVAAFLFRPSVAALPEMAEYQLRLRIGVGKQPELLLRELFAKHVTQSRLTAVSTARQGAAIDLTYAVRLQQEEGLVNLVGEASRLDGVQEVELQRR
jgi:uncharacterized membrane protein YhiD involved in acid resistance